MELTELKRVVEALIFAADAPLTAERIRETLPEELNGFDLDRVVVALNQDYDESGRAFFIRQVAGGYQVMTRPELHNWVKKLFLGRNKMRLSQAALETLAIVAFKQPISRVDVAQIRGVNSDGVIGTLLEKKLITISGRSDGVGRPLLYNTTSEFLQYFGVNDLADLPKPREIEELIGKEGMPEEVLQALSDEKQLELPINAEVEIPAASAEAAPAEDLAIASSELPDRVQPPPLGTAEEADREIASPVIEDSAETEIDAFPEEEPDADETNLPAKEDDSAPAENDEEKSAAPMMPSSAAEEPPTSIIAESEDGRDAPAPPAIAEPDLPPPLEAKVAEAAPLPEADRIAPAPGEDFFLEEAPVAVNDVPAPDLAERAAPSPAASRQKRKRQKQATAAPADEPEDLAPGQPEAPLLEPASAVHIVDLDGLANQVKDAAAIEAVIPIGQPSLETITPPELSEEQGAPQADAPPALPEIEPSVAGPAPVMITAKEYVAPDLVMPPARQAEAEWLPSRSVEAPALVERNAERETPLFFEPAPSERGAEPRLQEMPSPGGLLGFFKKAVGWIKTAWSKFVSR